MQRTVVYDVPTRRGAAGPAAGGAAPPTTAKDNYGDKLVKYIPAEVIAFYVPAYALIKGADDLGDGAKLLVLGLCLVGTLGYLYIRADKANPPRWYFYVLAVIAFLAWAIGTSDIGLIWGMGEEISKFTVLAGVFLVPMADEVLTKLLP